MQDLERGGLRWQHEPRSQASSRQFPSDFGVGMPLSREGCTPSREKRCTLAPSVRAIASLIVTIVNGDGV